MNFYQILLDKGDIQKLSYKRFRQQRRKSDDYTASDTDESTNCASAVATPRTQRRYSAPARNLVSTEIERRPSVPSASSVDSHEEVSSTARALNVVDAMFDNIKRDRRRQKYEKYRQLIRPSDTTSSERQDSLLDEIPFEIEVHNEVGVRFTI